MAGLSGWTRQKQQHLAREGIDKEPQNTPDKMKCWTSSFTARPRPPRFHVCSIAALFRVLDSTALVSAPTHSLGIGSFNSVSFHLHRP